ncbi:GTPase [Aquipuribacter hungaricus]|uniref:GTPase n=1 Tax=Aquipuribacter hungaricus TaxID=545624 RepID=A0ABV7WGU7_9MICO
MSPVHDDGFRAAFAQEAASLGRFTVVVLGRTGVGKSTLVNAVFGESLAETGIGAPVTQTSHLYSREGVGLAVVDTKGIEVGEDTEELLADLRALVAHSRTRPAEEQIHVAWFCVQAADLRLQDGERAVIEELDRLGIPVLLVMTRVPRLDGRNHPDAVAFHHAIQAMGLPVVGGRAWPVMALGDSFAGWPAHGLPELVEQTRTAAPAGVEAAFVAAQRVSPEAKAAEAGKVVAAAAAQAAAAAATPIPFADAVLLVLIQLRMMSRIALLHNVPVDRATLLAMASVAATTQAGRSIASGLVKMIPGAGTVAGGLVGAAVASSVTAAMGGAWITVCRRYGSDDLVSTVAFDPAVLQKAFGEEMARTLRSLGRRR